MTSLSMPYMFHYTCENSTFGHDFQQFATELGAKKVYGRYRGKGQGIYFYLVPTKNIYSKLKEVAKKKYLVNIQGLLRFREEDYPDYKIISEAPDESTNNKKVNESLETCVSNFSEEFSLYENLWT